MVVRVDKIETNDSFASKVDSIWTVIGLEAAPHLATRSAKTAVDVPKGDPAEPKPVQIRVDYECVFTMDQTVSSSPDDPVRGP